MDQVVSSIIGLCCVLITIGLYFLPAIIAYNRNHQSMAPIFIIDLFLGWTLIGWVACLAWAYSKVDKNSG